MGLALASAVVVLLASGVAINRIASEDSSDRSAGSAAPTPPPESTQAGAATGGQPAGDQSSDQAAGSAAASSTPAPVPPPVPARNSGQFRTGNAGQPATATTARASAGEATAGEATAGGSASGDTPAQAQNPDEPGGSGGSRPPSNQGEPGSSALLVASVSVGEGAEGAVVGAGLGGPSPDADVTVGDTPVVGDAPPSGGTGIGLGGRLLNPPPTVPTLLG